jgi:carboxymethylenebutenolidase
MVNVLATRLPELAAAAPFYGSPPPLEDVPKIKAELLVVLAATDERINAAWPGYEAALKAAGVRYALYQPPGTQHGFNNDTTPRYDEDAAAEAWSRMLALFARTLKA